MAQAGGLGFDSQWLPCTFVFQPTYFPLLQNWMMSVSALEQVAAAVIGALVQVAGIISALL